VLTIAEAPEHPHNKERATFIDLDGVVQPAPAPRFNRTPLEVRCPPQEPGANTTEALESWGFSRAEVADLREAKAVWQRPADG
jgi:alpha-methylacyl-CoA racemase